jgi:formylglycine-generating enzyme required for sulfatase activity
MSGVSRRHAGAPGRLSLRPSFRRVVVLAAIFAACGGAPRPTAGAPVWARLNVVENTAEGPAVDRCEIDGTVDGGGGRRWRVFYGEVRADAGSTGWAALRPGSGCAEVASESAPDPWALRGSPYLLVDVELGPAATSHREVRLEVSLTIRRLTGFAKAGAPAYERRSERRTLRVPEGDSAVIPVLVASPMEVDEFRVRELLLRFTASDPRARPQTEYGEIAVAADIPRADILLDGGFVGRTAAEGSVTIATVRVGAREIVVRDSSGREARAIARVEKGGRTDVRLNLLPTSPASGPGSLRPLGRNAQGSEEFWREKDGATVVHIPGGESRMGSPEGEGEPVEHPQHVVHLKAFLMDKTEVTWGQYRRFVSETGHPLPNAPVWGMPETFPVSNVTWEDARTFCAWAGGRLPTEAEWERAARGDDARRYPWGDDWDPSRCNTQDGGPHGPTAAGVYPDCVGPYGVLDLAGSVWEWCADWYDEAYYQESPADDPRGPETGRLRVSRGGSWVNPSQWARSAYRQGTEPMWPNPLRGFRCVEETAMASPLPRGAVPPPVRADTVSSRTEIRVETSVSRKAGPLEGCEIAQVTRNPIVSWSTFGEVAPKDQEAFELVHAATHCGAGTFPGASPPPPSGVGPAPFLILETSVTPFWDPGPMDPGPVPVAQIAFALTARHLTGFSSEGTPRYSDPVTDRRTIRLGEGEEFVSPVPLADNHARDVLGTDDVFVRIRAGQAGRPDATQYGTLWIVGAAPHSKVVLDGGTAGRVGADGSVLLATIPVGQREIRVRAASGPPATRVVAVVRGRTVVVSANPVDGDSPPQPPLTPAGKNSQGFPEFRRARDSAVMVQIPEGEFVMGNLDTEGKPLPHPVYVSAFLMDKLPVTWGLFKRFAAATGRPLPPDPYWGIHDDYPVAFVRWDEGRAYCEWAGGRLPTEAEREKAARGTDGRKFPWGNEEPTPERGVFRREWGYEGNDTVGIRPAGASPYGLLDAGGNMWEWCEDWYGPDYYKSGPRENPLGPRTGRARVVRGGSWDSRPTVLSASCRNWGYVGYREGDYGFRCAGDPVSPR